MDILKGYQTKVAVINDGLKRAGIERDELVMLDHICYRTETLDEYRTVVEQANQTIGRSIGEIEVEGRPISTIALNQPLKTGGWVIPFLEIASPKDGSPYPSGLEHAEFVPAKLLGDFERDHAELNFIRAMDRVINPELKYREDGISVKFHQLSLGSVVKIEERLAQ